MNHKSQIEKNLSKIILASSLTLLASSNVFAEDKTAEGKWTSSIEFGYVATSGNNDTTSTNGRLNLGYEVDKWKHAAFVAVQGNTNDASPDSDTENYNAQLKSDYMISDRMYAYGILDYDQIDNSGFDNQTSIGAGLGYNFIKTDEHILDGEIGYGYRESNLELVDANGRTTLYEGVARIAANYKWIINENANFEQSLSSEIGDDNTISNSLSSLSANVAENLAMKFSYEIRHQSDVPLAVPEIEKKDTVTSFTVVYTF